MTLEKGGTVAPTRLKYGCAGPLRPWKTKLWTNADPPASILTEDPSAWEPMCPTSTAFPDHQPTFAWGGCVTPFWLKRCMWNSATGCFEDFFFPETGAFCFQVSLPSRQTYDGDRRSRCCNPETRSVGQSPMLKVAGRERKSLGPQWLHEMGRG